MPQRAHPHKQKIPPQKTTPSYIYCITRPCAALSRWATIPIEVESSTHRQPLLPLLSGRKNPLLWKIHTGRQSKYARPLKFEPNPNGRALSSKSTNQNFRKTIKEIFIKNPFIKMRFTSFNRKEILHNFEILNPVHQCVER